MAKLRRLKKRLSAIEANDERGVRREVLDSLLELCGAEVGLAITVGEHEGDLYYTGAVTSGSESATALHGAFAHRRITEVGLWDPSLPRPAERQKFVGLHHGPVPLERVRASENYALFYEPLGIQDHARALLYDGDRFIAWVGLMREDAASFAPPELALLNRVLPTIAAPLIAAENLRRGWQDVPLLLVFGAESFRLRLASPRASEWLSAERRALIVDFLRALRAGTAPAMGHVDGYMVSAARLIGDDGPAFHVNVRLPRAVSLSPLAALTPREREVAELAAAGATAVEISAELGNAASTVRGHIKSIYRRLGIATRAELAAMLRRDGR